MMRMGTGTEGHFAVLMWERRRFEAIMPGDSRERKVRPGQGGTPPRRVQRRPPRSSQASRSRVRGAALANPIRNGTYGTRKVATANGKITTTPEGAGYHRVFAGALEGEPEAEGVAAGGCGEGSRRRRAAR